MADALVLRLRVSFFSGRVQVGQALYYAFFTTLWVKRSPVSATRFFRFLFFIFCVCFVCPSAVALFSPVANSFFPLKLHSPCFFPVCGQRTGGVKVESLPKTPAKTATKLGNP